MAHVQEITVPDTKPATEWVRGRALQKVSPRGQHARAQSGLAEILRSWARGTGLGQVGTEWEFRVTPPHEVTRPLVPDVAYVSYARLPFEDEEGAELPHMAPDVVFEILSPTDRAADVAHKVGVYLASGSSLVVVVDPLEQSFVSHDASGVAHYATADVFSHSVLPGLVFQVGSVFERPTPKR